MDRLALFTRHPLSLHLLILSFLFMRIKTEHAVCRKMMKHFILDSFLVSWFSSITQLFMGLWSFENDWRGWSLAVFEGVVPWFWADALWTWLNHVLVPSQTRILISYIASNISQNAAANLTFWVAWPWLLWGGVVCDSCHPGAQSDRQTHRDGSWQQWPLPSSVHLLTPCTASHRS